MRATITLIVSMLLCGSLCAKQQPETLQLSAGEPGLLQIQHTGTQMDVNISGSTNYQFSHSPFSTQYLFFPAKADQAQTILVDISATSNITDNVSIEAHQVTSNETPLALYKKTLDQLSIISASNANIESNIEDLLGLLSIHFFRDRDFQEFIRHQLLNILQQKANWGLAYDVMNSLRSNSGRSIIAQCQFTRAFIQDNQKQDPSLSLGILANLAGAISVYARSKGNLDDNAAKPLNIKSYQYHCGPIFTDKHSPFKQKQDHTQSSDWQLNQDAKLLFAYLINNQTKTDNKARPHLLTNLWFYYNFSAMHEQAQLVAKQGLQIFDAANQHTNERALQLLNLLFISSTRLGHFAQARAVATRTLNLDPEQHPNSHEVMLFNSGALYSLLGEFEVSNRYFNSAIASAAGEKTPLTWKDNQCNYDGKLQTAIGRSAVQNAAVLRQNERYDDAKKWLLCAQTLLHNSRHYYELVVKIELAKILVIEQQYTKAKQLVDAVLEDTRALKNTRIDGLLLHAKIQQQTKHQSALQRDIEQIAAIFGYSTFFDKDLEISDIYAIRQIEIFTFLIQLHKNDKDKEWVELFAKLTLELIEKHGTNASNAQAWNAARYEFIQTYLSAIYRPNGNAPQSNALDLLEILEQYYSVNPTHERNLFAVEQSKAANHSSAEALFKKWITLERQQIEDNSAALLTALDRARDEYLSNLKKNERKKPLYNQQKIDLVRQNMPADHILVRYVLSDTVNFRLTVTSKSIDVDPILGVADINSLINKLSDSIHSSRRFSATSSELSSKLLPLELLASGHYKKLVIIPDGRLHKVPFSALPVQDKQGVSHPLMTSTETVLTHSLISYYDNQPEQNSDASFSKNKTFSMSLFADPTFSVDQASINTLVESNTINNRGSAYKQLPGTLAEAQTIISLFGNNLVRTGLKEQATNGFLMSKKTREASLLHIATHGYFAPERPDLVGLMTSANNKTVTPHSGFLSLSELLSKPVSSDLVVISGCETMLGKNYKGSGMRSISRGFLSQGAGAVLGTLWPVQDRSTSVFMTEFYRHLINLDGNTSAALRATKLQFSTTGRYRNPVHWAGFVLTSSSNRREKIVLPEQLQSFPNTL